jgi:hypothetical protein
MRRRNCEWTAAEEKMWEEIFRLTQADRYASLKT